LHFALATRSNVTGADTLDFASQVNNAAGSIVSSLESVVNEFTTIAAQIVNDPGGALRSFKTYLTNNGVSLPSWLQDSIDQIADILDAANAVGIHPVLNAILNGVDLPGLDGINVPATCIGVTVLGTCYGIPVPATCIVTVVNGHCYSIPPIHLPGVCDLPVFDNVAAFQDGCTVQEFANVVLIGPINTILEGIVQGVSAVTSTLEGVFGGSGALFSLNCASFDLHLSGSTDTTSDNVGLAIDATVLGHEGGFAFNWNFGASIGSNIKSFLNAVFDAIAHPGPVACSSPDTTLFGTTGSPPSTPPTTPAVFSTFSVPSSVSEGSPVTVGGTFDRALASSRTVTIHWGDGSQSSVSIAQGATSFTTSHTYSDDNPTATAHDLVGLSAGDGTTSITKSLTLNNVAPSAVTATLAHSTIDEGATAALTVSFSDPGTPDTHTLDVNWGDGTITHTPLGAGVTTANPTHLYADDNPSGSPADVYPIGVTVTDDDTGSGSGSTSLTVDNVAPTFTGSALSPTTVNEGQTLTYTVSFADVGVLDPHTVQVDWNNDGTYDAVQPVAAGVTSATFTWDFTDDDPTGTPQDVTNVKVLVTDDDTGSVTRTVPVTVKNVAPTVTGLTVSAATIAEGGTVILSGSFDDPGLPDTHTIAIDWGSPQVQGPASLAVDSSTTVGRTFSTTATYGDNGTYPITVVVTDDDTGSVTASTQVIVTNVKPTSAIDLSTAIAAGNGPTLLTSAGAPLGVSARSTDPGSDDLTVTWTWDVSGRYDTTTSTKLYKVNPPDLDPAQSPSVQPRDVTDARNHTWTQPCLYTIKSRWVDDDGGAAADTAPLIVVGNETKPFAPGWWYQEYRVGGNHKLDAATRQCDLDIVGQASRVFHEQYDVSDAAGAALYLNNSNGTSDAHRLLGRPLLTAWLNFASGAIGWNQRVDTNCDGRADTVFNVAMHHAEDVFLNPASTRSQLLGQQAVVSCFDGE
ncbi:MAG TPA: hypothetical protein VNN79_21250, partial [Actinomycetota bacterium]|nr:hypothetical protein [Actinomycetota bacterium]